MRARAEAAADIGLDDTNVGFVDAETARQGAVHIKRYLGTGVNRQPAARRVPFGNGGVGLHVDLVDLGAVEDLLAHQVGGGEPGHRVAEFEVDLAFDIAGPFRVQRHGVGRQRLLGVAVGRQFLVRNTDSIERRPGGLGIHGGDRGDGLAPVAHPIARQGKLVFGDGQHAERHVAIGAGDHRAHAGHGARGADIDVAQFGVAGGAAQDRPDQRAGLEIRAKQCLARDLVGAVDQRRPGADAAQFHDAAAWRTASMIFT